MGVALVAAQGAAPLNSPAGLAAFCLGGLAAYALAAALTGAVTRDDWALLTKKS
jgi:putative peptidoglycan lipid II flippase